MSLPKDIYMNICKTDEYSMYSEHLLCVLHCATFWG